MRSQDETIGNGVMSQATMRTAIMDNPGGEICAPSQARPVDLVHLAKQTMGDRMLEEEVLQLFMQQAVIIGDRIIEAEPTERKRLAHTLKGSARGIGAFIVADRAYAIEQNPDRADLIDGLVESLHSVREFIASITR